jgi:hypothetical protein
MPPTILARAQPVKLVGQAVTHTRTHDTLKLDLASGKIH